MSPDFLETCMKLATAEGRRWMGATSPNPPVGAVALDAHGKILAKTAHHRAGEKHAEALIIEECEKAGTLSDLHTLCVTLEPCNHFGRTPPCSEAIIKAGIKHVVFGTSDPNPNVKGGGAEKLKTAGIEVVSGVEKNECDHLFHAFAYRVRNNKPWVTVKRAFNSESSMIPPKGQNTFTSPESLKLAHHLRKKSDAILTGSGTIISDNPLFTVRHVPDHSNKRRWLGILDRRGRVSPEYILAAKDRGLDVIIYQNVATAVNDLAQKGAQDILVEAGPQLSQSLLDSDLWTMSVTIRQGKEDVVEAMFNSRQTLPFDARQFRWDYFLPQE